MADAERDQRITHDILVDAYTFEEQMSGWYYYLEDKIEFPFIAQWDDHMVTVMQMANEEECERDIFVEILYSEAVELEEEEEESNGEDVFSVRLVDVEPVDGDEDSVEAIADWKYWQQWGLEEW